MVVPQGSFRVKLEFDIPPPAFPASSKYVILVKPDEYKTIHDLEVLIIRKFGFSNGAIASLSLDGFCLPSTEDVHVLSHNDYINVTMIQDASQKRVRKRKIRNKKPVKDKEEFDDTFHILSPKRMKLDSMRKGDVKANATMIKTKPKENGVHVSDQVFTESRELKLDTGTLSSLSSGTDISRHARKTDRSTLNCNIKGMAKSSVAPSNSKTACKVGKILPDGTYSQSSESGKPISMSKARRCNASKATPNCQHAKGTAISPGFLCKQSIESSSGESEEKKAKVKKRDTPKGHSTAPVQNLNFSNSKERTMENSKSTSIMRGMFAHPADNSKLEQSLEDQSAPKATTECRDTTWSNIKNHHSGPAVKTSKQTKRKETKEASSCNKSHITFDSSSASDSEDEKFADTSMSSSKPQDLNSWLNTAKACITKSKQTWSTKPVDDPGVSSNLSSIYIIPELTDELQGNCLGEVGDALRPPRDYHSMAPLTWPPRVGDIFAYKILEMSKDYCPIISDYKEVKVEKVLFAQSSPIGVDSVQVQRLWPKSSVLHEGGRFEMVFEDEEIESQETNVVTLEWKMLLEPKLIE